MSEELKTLLAARLRLLSDAGPDRPLRSDFDLNPHFRPAEVRGLRPAAVLVPIVERTPPTLLLTRRADTLPTHAGQISFPGGRVEPDDDGVAGAALREAYEEIGLHRDFVTLAGLLDPYETVTGFQVTPVVGIVRPGFTLSPDAVEVAEAFEVPFAFVMDPANHEKRSTVWQGRERTYYAMPYERHFIWGATAGMLINLYERLYL